MPRKKIKIEIPEKTLAERCTELARVINDNRYEFDDYGDDLGYTVEETELLAEKIETTYKAMGELDCYKRLSYDEVRRTAKDWYKEVVFGDGHSFFDPSFYIEAGVPALFVYSLLSVTKSDPSDYKTTLFDGNGKEVDELLSVHHMRFLYAVSVPLEVDLHSMKFGRGSQASEYAGQIHARIEEKWL